MEESEKEETWKGIALARIILQARHARCLWKPHGDVRGGGQ